jgi:hypothetical protein
MRVGFFAPINYNNLCCTSIAPCYAKYIVSNPNYLAYYKLKKTKGATLYLDTAPNLPRQSNLQCLLSAAQQLRPQYTILPSKDYDYARTVGLSLTFIQMLEKTSIKSKCVGVLQGVDIGGINQCYKGLKDYVGVIGLPSVLETVAPRADIVRELGIYSPIVYIEVYANPNKETHSDKKTVMLTSFPIRLGLSARKLSEHSPTPRPLNYELPKGESLIKLAIENIKEYLEIVR